ncbi:MAG: hypothetical protein M3Z32_04070 [Acidobacteriota bacterium]|nr:hypothetical protein [Acidobacteriota bacterium]
MGRKAGLTQAQFLDLNRFESSAEFNDRERLVMRYASAMTQTPVHVPDDMFDELRRSFNDKQLVELTSAIAWENYRARFNRAFQIEAEGFSDGALCSIPERVEC